MKVTSLSILADHTARSIMSYCHHNVVCPSVCDKVYCG